MKILEEYSDDEIRAICERETPKPETGIWILTSPSGKIYAGDRPTACVIAEVNERIPPLIALARIRLSILGG